MKIMKYKIGNQKKLKTMEKIMYTSYRKQQRISILKYFLKK